MPMARDFTFKVLKMSCNKRALMGEVIGRHWPRRQNFEHVKGGIL